MISTLNTYWKDWCWNFFGYLMQTDDSLEKTLILGKIERKEGIRDWDGWMASPMHWTWTWANSGRFWGTGRPAMLWSMGLRRVRHDWVTEQKQEVTAEKGKKGFQIWKAIQGSLFTENLIRYNHKDATRKLLELINECGKIEG